MKPVNAALANEFHVWQRDALPRCVIQDLDAWAIVASDPESYEPAALFELKRSSAAPEAWRPYAADRANYASLDMLARRAGIPLFVVYWQKGRPIDDETLFRVTRFSDVVPEYHGRAAIVSAQTFAERFPYPLVELAP
jgi:hypothetical protein